MSSFQLVNHQLKHLFGGIQAETNSSIDYLENDQKKIAKSMQKAKANHLKIYDAVSTIKNSLSDLSENCFNLSKETKQSGSILWRLSNQINHVLQDISQESLSLSKKMAAKMEYFLPGLKKTKEKYTEYAQNLQHYRQKLVLLKKSVQKQPSSNILPEDKERYQRNIQKFRKAQKQYDQILIKTTTKFVNFNNEGMKDICYDLVSIFSTFSSNIIQSGHRMTQFLQQIPQLSKINSIQPKNKSVSNGQRTNNLSYLHESSLHSKQIKQQKDFIQKLIIEKQISNYLKEIIDKDLIKISNKKIKEQFGKSQAENKKEEVGKTKQFFKSFQNQYNNNSLEHHKNHLLEKMKEQDPLQACVDLLDIAKPDQAFKKAKQIGEKSKQKSESHLLLQISPQQEKIKKNLDKFNKICEQNPILKQKNLQKQKNNQAKNSPTINQNSKSPKTLKTKEQFFSLSFFDKNETKQQNQKNLQQQLTRLHQHPFDFKIFQKPAQNTLLQPSPSLNQKPHPKVGDSPNPKPIFHSAITFDNFDFIIKDHQTDKKPDSNLSIPATPNISANFKQKKSTTFEDFDLLNL